jgi:hypothetical protein
VENGPSPGGSNYDVVKPWGEFLGEPAVTEKGSWETPTGGGFFNHNHRVQEDHREYVSKGKTRAKENRERSAKGGKGYNTKRKQDVCEGG